MTKTLTEQWRDGELEWGLYYVKTKKDAPLFCGEITEMNLEKEITISQDEKVEEVLASVPSYQEFVQQRDFVKDHMKVLIENMNLKRKLEIATKALEDYANSDEWELVDSKSVYWSRKRFPYPWRIAGKALKEMEGVK